MICANNGGKSKKVYIVLSCVFNSLINNYVFIDYLSCQSKILSSISSKQTFKLTSFNKLLGIGITEMLLNLVSYQGFVKKPNSTMILNFQYLLVNNYLSKGLYII